MPRAATRIPELYTEGDLARKLIGFLTLAHSLPAINTPVPWTGADGAKAALALLWERRQEVPGAFPVMAIHDEVVVECDAEQAQAVAAWLKQAMLDAMRPLLDPVPVDVDATVARTWGGN